MSKTPRPPLTPSDAVYMGMDEHEIHKLRWRSQSRDGVAHTTTGTNGEAGYCTCEAFQWSLVGDGPIGCKHTRCWSDALRHHLGPPPADPGGAVGEPPELAGLAECEDAARDDWETVELSPEHPGGFWAATAYGPMHVSGDPHMPEETLTALREMAELAVRQYLDPAPNMLDALIAAGGDHWLVSRTPPRVTLTCPACHHTLVFLSEDSAASYLAGYGRCRCGAGGADPARAGGGAQAPTGPPRRALRGGVMAERAFTNIRRGITGVLADAAEPHTCGPMCRDGVHADLTYTTCPYDGDIPDYFAALAVDLRADYDAELVGVEPAYDVPRAMSPVSGKPIWPYLMRFRWLDDD